MPEAAREPKRSVPEPKVVQGPATREAPVGPMGAAYVQRVGRQVGNRTMAQLVTGRPQGGPPRPLQRVAIKEKALSETLYENPGAVATPTAAQKQFTATSYGQKVGYDMTRTGTAVEVVVKVRFVAQDRGEKQWKTDATGAPLLDGSGAKIPDPTYGRDIGTPKEIKDAERIDFAKARCESIGKTWDHYDLVSKERPATGFFALFRSAPRNVRLPVKFRAEPVFSMTGAVHNEIRLFGMGTDAKRDGAHPVDSGHWYMNTKKHYGDMDEDAIAAHEYGHLLGLQDEYSRSNDQMHQTIHRMGSGNKNADKEFDRQSVRQMTTLALWRPLASKFVATMGAVGDNVAAAKGDLQRQLARALRTTWADAGLRKELASLIQPGLKYDYLRRTVPQVVDFQAGENFSNLTVAADAVAGVTRNAIWDAAAAELEHFNATVAGEGYKITGAGGTESTITADYSDNVHDAGVSGPNAPSASATVDKLMGKGLPKVKASPGILDDIAALPAYWKTPGKGIDRAYTPAVVSPELKAVVETATAAGILPNVKTYHQLYQKVLTLVTSASKQSSARAVGGFITDSVRPKVRDQLAGLQARIDNEVDSIMGMGAKGVAATSADPDIAKLATQMATMIKTQQNPKIWDQKANVDPGAGSAGSDVRYTASSMMGNNNTAKEGFRADMIDPVVKQFNAHKELKKDNEEPFKAVSR